MLNGSTGYEHHGQPVDARADGTAAAWSLGCVAPVAVKRVRPTVLNPNPIFGGMTTTDRPKEAPR